MKQISFDVRPEEHKLILRIADRAVALARKNGIPYKTMDAVMDIEATHANGNPLRLRELLEADDANFGHDVFGIRKYLNRETGELGGCFDPRFSAPQRSVHQG